MSYSTTQSGTVAEVREATRAALESQSCPESARNAIDAELEKLEQDRPVSLSAYGHTWSADQTAGEISLHLTVAVPYRDAVGG